MASNAVDARSRELCKAFADIVALREENTDLKALIEGLEVESKAHQAEIRTWRKGFAAKTKTAKNLKSEVIYCSQEIRRLRALLQESRKECIDFACRLQKLPRAALQPAAVKAEVCHIQEHQQHHHHQKIQERARRKHTQPQEAWEQQQLQQQEQARLGNRLLDSQRTWDPLGTATAVSADGHADAAVGPSYMVEAAAATPILLTSPKVIKSVVGRGSRKPSEYAQLTDADNEGLAPASRCQSKHVQCTPTSRLRDLPALAEEGKSPDRAIKRRKTATTADNSVPPPTGSRESRQPTGTVAATDSAAGKAAKGAAAALEDDALAEAAEVPGAVAAARKVTAGEAVLLAMPARLDGSPAPQPIPAASHKETSPTAAQVLMAGARQFVGPKTAKDPGHQVALPLPPRHYSIAQQGGRAGLLVSREANVTPGRRQRSTRKGWRTVVRGLAADPQLSQDPHRASCAAVLGPATSAPMNSAPPPQPSALQQPWPWAPLRRHAATRPGAAAARSEWGVSIVGVSKAGPCGEAAIMDGSNRPAVEGTSGVMAATAVNSRAGTHSPNCRSAREHAAGHPSVQKSASTRHPDPAASSAARPPFDPRHSVSRQSLRAEAAVTVCGEEGQSTGDGCVDSYGASRGPLPATVATPHGNNSVSKVKISRDSDVGYKYVEVVRRRADRERLRGFECQDCKKFYETLALHGGTSLEHLPTTCRQDAAGPTMTPDSRGGGGSGGRQEGLLRMRQEASRHRAAGTPPQTAPGYWDLGFYDSLDSRVPVDSQ